MCEPDVIRGVGWRGWHAPDTSTDTEGYGEWFDLSHPIDRNLPRVPFFPEPVLNRVYSIPEHQINVTSISMVVHSGTHVDSPRHFFNDGPAFQDIPLSRLCGAGLVFPVSVNSDGLIEPEHLMPAERLLKPGDILLLNTGAHRRAGSKDYDDHPALSEAGAQWIVDHQIKLVGVDMPTPDEAVKRRTQGFCYPVHRKLLANGVLIAEHLTNLDPLTGLRVEVMMNALNIADSDGAPVRALARRLKNG